MQGVFKTRENGELGMQQNDSLGITKIALDAMGGDNAPVEPVKGAVDAVAARKDIKVFLVGQKDVIQKEL